MPPRTHSIVLMATVVTMAVTAPSHLTIAEPALAFCTNSPNPPRFPLPLEVAGETVQSLIFVTCGL